MRALRLRQEPSVRQINRILALPEVRQRFAQQGVRAIGGTPEQFGAYLDEQMTRWAKVVKEAGVRIGAVRYIASQPWPFPSSLMIGCTAKALDDRLTIDTTELEDARWFTREEVEAALRGEPDTAFIAPPRFAIARTLIDRWARA